MDKQYVGIGCEAPYWMDVDVNGFAMERFNLNACIRTGTTLTINALGIKTNISMVTWQRIPESEVEATMPIDNDLISIMKAHMQDLSGMTTKLYHGRTTNEYTGCFEN